MKNPPPHLYAFLVMGKGELQRTSSKSEQSFLHQENQPSFLSRRTLAERTSKKKKKMKMLENPLGAAGYLPQSFFECDQEE